MLELFKVSHDPVKLGGHMVEQYGSRYIVVLVILVIHKIKWSKVE